MMRTCEEIEADLKKNVGDYLKLSEEWRAVYEEAKVGAGSARSELKAKED